MEPIKDSTYIIICAWLQTKIEDLDGSPAPSAVLIADGLVLGIIPKNKRSYHDKPIFTLTATMLKDGLTDSEWNAIIYKIQNHLNKHPLCRLKFGLPKSKERSLQIEKEKT